MYRFHDFAYQALLPPIFPVGSKVTYQLRSRKRAGGQGYTHTHVMYVSTDSLMLTIKYPYDCCWFVYLCQCVLYLCVCLPVCMRVCHCLPIRTTSPSIHACLSVYLLICLLISLSICLLKLGCVLGDVVHTL